MSKNFIIIIIVYLKNREVDFHSEKIRWLLHFGLSLIVGFKWKSIVSYTWPRPFGHS